MPILTLAGAFALAVVFTVAGVIRRTRENGTRKAIGWSHRRVVGQVAGELLAQLLSGGTPAVAGVGAEVPSGGGFGGNRALTTAEVALQAPNTPQVVLITVGIAVVGGLTAGGIGG